MRARLWPAVAVSFGALILLSILFAWLVSREEARRNLLDKLNRAAENLHPGKDGKAAKAACADGAGQDSVQQARTG